MRKFIVKTLLFVLSFLIIYVLLYFTINLCYNTKEPSNSLFIWGDSQTYQGIDLSVLKERTNKKIYTAAHHGAGVYDFLVFCETVPSYSDVIISISKPVQLRRKDKDRNLSGISLFAIKKLLENNYSLKEVFQILKKNRKPSKIFLTKTKQYSYEDSINIKEPIELFESIYSSIPLYMPDKQNIYLEGFKKLTNKKCKFYLITFPYHEILSQIEFNSPVKNHTDAFLEKVQIKTNCYQRDSLILKTDKQVMHDLTHLNCYGAKQVSEFIGEKVEKQDFGLFCISIKY